MKWLIVPVLAVLVALAFTVGHRDRHIDMAEFGRVQLLPAENAAKGFGIVFSDAGGPDESDHQAIQALGKSGFTVAAIDTRQALRKLEKLNPNGACVDLPGPLEWLSTTAERDLGWSQYRPPLLLGRGAGGGLVYAALAQAPETFAGGASVDFRGILPLHVPLCRLPKNLSATAPMGARWLVGKTSDFAHEVNAVAVDAPGTAGVSGSSALPPGPLAALYGEAAARLSDAPTTGGSATVADLPLVEVSSRTSFDTLAVIYSGDGGWRDIDKQLGEVLAARGMAVVGVDSLRYFWSAQTPERVSADLRRIFTHYTAAWRIRHVVLIGYSFGADILPFAYGRLSADLQAQVNQISLLAPGRAADFEIQPLGWFGAGPSGDARPIPPETARLDRAKMQCIYGANDARDSLCTDPAARGMEVIAHPGGHHFNSDYRALAKAVLTGACRRGVACQA